MNTYSLARYHVTALTLKFFSLTPSLRFLYRFLSNRSGRRHTKVSQTELDRGKWVNQRIGEAQFPPGEQLTVLELGTGWTHFYAIFLRLFLNAKITLFDVQDNRNLSSLKIRCANLLRAFSTFPIPELIHDHEMARVRELLGSIITVESFEKLYQLLDMTYVIDSDGRLDQLPDRSFDVVFSVDVLEHVDSNAIDATAHSLYRVLKPGGISIHQIGLDDHLAHYAAGMPSKNYMRYSNSTWKLLFENRLQYINRIQLTDFLSVFEKTNFELIEYTTEEDASLDRLQLHQDFLRFDSETIRSTRAYLTHRKPISS